ncbi:SseB family protein [Profundibacter sp.]
MTDLTPLDTAHAMMDAAPDDTGKRLRFFERLADSELFLLLQGEAVDDRLSPEVFEVESAKYVLVFDREERLAEFVEGSAHHAALSGRVVAKMLMGQQIGLALNLGVAPSSILLAPDTLGWLADMLDNAPDEVMARPSSFAAPTDVPEALLLAIDSKLATAAGLATSAYLVSVTYEDGRHGLLLAIIDALPAAHGALAKAVGEAVIFAAQDDGGLDVAFFAAGDAVCATLAKVGLRFDLPQRSVETHTPAAPGRDPNSPPILR